jgi:hypothetical protein
MSKIRRATLSAAMVSVCALALSACAEPMDEGVSSTRIGQGQEPETLVGDDAFCSSLLPYPRTDLDLSDSRFSGKTVEDRISLIHEVCADRATANLVAGVLLFNEGEVQQAISTLEEVRSSNPEIEPRRMLVMYIAYGHILDFPAMTRVAAAARTTFPDSPQSRLILAAEACADPEGDCVGAIPDLQAAETALASELAVQTLVIAYASASRWSDAARIVDSGKLDVARLDDATMYSAVVALCNVHRANDAAVLFRKYRASHPGTESQAVGLARAALDSSGVSVVE